MAVVCITSTSGGLWVYHALQAAPDRSDRQQRLDPTGPGSDDRRRSHLSGPVSGASVWRRLGADLSLVAELVSSCPHPAPATGCVTLFMREHAAPEAAADFYRRTGTFLVMFKGSGEMDVGIVLDPWLANNNTRTVLLNGETSIFYPSASELSSAVRRDPDFQSVRGVFPDLDVGIQFPLFEAARRDGGEGSGYLFQFYLEDGCHACDTGFRARVIFTFDKDEGRLGSRSLGICNSNEAVDTPIELSHVPPCPSPPPDLYRGSADVP